MHFFDSDKVHKAATYNKWVDTIEEALLRNRDIDYSMPQRSHIDFGDNTLLLMPCIGRDYFATKLVSVFPGNINSPLPQVSGTVLLNSAHTGEALALIDGTALTALRTAAVGSFGIRHLAPANISTLGVIGLGTQGTYQCLMACSQRRILKVNIYDNNPDNTERFRKRILVEYPGIELVECADTLELCRSSEVIITASSSSVPVLPDNRDELSGKTIIGIGSYKPDMREFPDALYSLTDKVFVDTEDGISESGDLIYPLDKGLLKTNQIISAHEMLIKKIEPGNTRVFKSVGMALFDLYGAVLVYESHKDPKN